MVDVDEYLSQTGVPGRRRQSGDSDDRFPDDSRFKIEMLPSTVDEYMELLRRADEHDVCINRFTDITGTVFDTDETIQRKCSICN